MALDIKTAFKNRYRHPRLRTNVRFDDFGHTVVATVSDYGYHVVHETRTGYTHPDLALKYQRQDRKTALKQAKQMGLGR